MKVMEVCLRHSVEGTNGDSSLLAGAKHSKFSL